MTRKTIRVDALLPQERTRTLLEEELTLSSLPLLTPLAPLSRMILNGAGMEYRPKGIAVYLEGELVWEAQCHEKGPTDYVRADRRTNHRPDVPTVTFTRAFGKGADWDDESIADQRAAWEHLRNTTADDHEWADDTAAELLEAAAWLRPALEPTKPADRPADDTDPCPCPVAVPVTATEPRPNAAQDAMWRTRYATREHDEWLTALGGYRSA